MKFSFTFHCSDTKETPENDQITSSKTIIMTVREKKIGNPVFNYGQIR